MAQVKKKSKTYDKAVNPLISIKQKSEHQQIEAIEDLSALIEKASDEEDYSTLYQANIILGDINYKNKLYELAAQRYAQSYQYEKLLAQSIEQTVSEKLGNAYLQLKDNRAIAFYNRCVDETETSEQILNCKEGLSVAYYNKGDYDYATNILQELEKTYAIKDSSNLSRIQALLAKVAVANNDQSYADLNLNNAYANYKKVPKADKDIEILQSSKQIVLDNADSTFNKADFLRSNVAITERNIEAQLSEQTNLIKVLVSEGETDEADKSIAEAKKSIEAVKDLSVKADFFKQSSENSALKGDYESALKDYKKYESNQSILLKQKEKEINSRLAVLESQKNVEISEKTFSSRKSLGVSEQKRSEVQRYIIYLLGLLLLGSILGGFIIWRNLKAKNILNKKLHLQSLRAQMNPHFIFNALNSVNEFIATQDEKKANKYLSDFSKLMRYVLEVNQKETIDLSDEISLSELYLKLEHDRFQDKFDFKLKVDPSLRHSEVQIPPLLLQPYIENAIWHGLRYRKDKGLLEVSISSIDNAIEIEIRDDGIGRENSKIQKTKFQKQKESTGMKNTRSRMEIVEKLYGNSFDLEITDASTDKDNPGTLVKIKLSNRK